MKTFPIQLLTLALSLFSCQHYAVYDNETNAPAVSFAVSTTVVTTDTINTKSGIYTPLGTLLGTTLSLVEEVSPRSVNFGSPSITRTAFVSSIDADFAIWGYAGTTDSTISKTPSFLYNAKTSSAGVPYEKVLWSWEKPFARFFAIYPYVEAGTNENFVLPSASSQSTPNITFTVEDATSDQKDLMVATTDIVQYATKYVSPTVNLNFRHALTAVSFKVGAGLPSGLNITQIELTNVCSKGKYILPTSADGEGKWSSLTTRKSFIVSGLSVSTSDEGAIINPDANILLMIPQTLKSSSNTIQAIFTLSDGSTLTATLAGSWLAGTTKTYTISVTPSVVAGGITVTPPTDDTDNTNLEVQ